MVGKTSPANKKELIRYIKKSGEKYHQNMTSRSLLIQSMRRRLQAVIDAQGGHNLYNLRKP